MGEGGEKRLDEGWDGVGKVYKNSFRSPANARRCIMSSQSYKFGTTFAFCPTMDKLQNDKER